MVRSSRLLVGNTNPIEASPGTIRGDLCAHISRYVRTHTHSNLHKLPYTNHIVSLHESVGSSLPLFVSEM